MTPRGVGWGSRGRQPAGAVLTSGRPAVSRPDSAAHATGPPGRDSRCAPRSPAGHGRAGSAWSPTSRSSRSTGAGPADAPDRHDRGGAVCPRGPDHPGLTPAHMFQRKVCRVPRGGCGQDMGCLRQGPAASSRRSTLTPEKRVSNFDQVVTQWMSPRYSDSGSSCRSAQLHVCGSATNPSTDMVQRSASSRGVTSALSTGKSLPTSYCPGGSRGSRSAWCRPRNPRVKPLTTAPACEAGETRGSLAFARVLP